ncbi:RNA-binding protein 25-like, partial [Ctenocephalides felis]|uniref:RNA-binding protein 25-like n=1 Tax=Ctenocephalides felis TaxID=7515 RepID=UPI000E6E571C
MSFTGRPPMGPNMAYMPPNMMPPMPVMQMPPHVMPGGMPMRPFCPPGPPPMRPPFNKPPPQISAPPQPAQAPAPTGTSDGPAVTVFVGNITEKAPDTMIRQILSACGPVVSWKRVSAFGFCEFSCPEAGLRAVRLLHDLEIGGKKLVAKVDAKTKIVLDEYKAEERKKLKPDDSSPTQDEVECDSEYMNDNARDSDKTAMIKIKATISEYENDINNFDAIKE